MGMPLETIEVEALNLPSHERARLARRLLDSLDDGCDEDSSEVERAWEQEIQRRAAEIDAGTADLVPAEASVRGVTCPDQAVKINRVRFLRASRVVFKTQSTSITAGSRGLA